MLKKNWDSLNQGDNQVKVDVDKLIEKYLHRPKPETTQENKYKSSQEPNTEEQSCPSNADTP